jgi:phosphonate transport system permease protein
MMATTPPSPRNRHRDPAARGRLVGALVALVIVWPLLVWAEFKPWTLLGADSLQPTLRFLGDFVPPRHDAAFLAEVAHATWRTLAMATVGMTLALILAVPLALVATRTLSLSGLAGPMAWVPARLRQCMRVLLVVLRSVPELVWALVLVRVVGLGPTAGVLAIALTYAGMLGKVYAEILESGDAHATHTLMRNGAGRLQALVHGLLPHCATELTSYTVYRWECAVRSSAVLGFVGAGGLGQLMDASMKMFNGSEVSTLLLVFMALVLLADSVSNRLRQALT